MLILCHYSNATYTVTPAQIAADGTTALDFSCPFCGQIFRRGQPITDYLRAPEAPAQVFSISDTGQITAEPKDL